MRTVLHTGVEQSVFPPPSARSALHAASYTPGYCLLLATRATMASAARAANPVVVLMSCGFYMACSAGMMIVNKMVLRSLPLPMTVVTIQMATTVIALVTTSSSLHFGSVRDVMRWATTIPLLFTFMLASSMLALDLASMGAIVVVRNVAPIITLAMERAMSEHIELDASTILSMLVIIGGVVLYTYNDIQFSAAGLLLMGFNMVSAEELP